MTGKKRPEHTRERPPHEGGHQTRMSDTARRDYRQGHSGTRPDKSRQMNRNPGSAAKGSKKPGKKKKKGRSGRKRLLGFVIWIGVLVLLGYLASLLFQVREIQVTGNQYCSDEEVTEWITQDPYAKYSLYILWKSRQKGQEYPPMVEELKVVLRSPWKVEVQVKEKICSGRISYQEGFLYFDRKGIAALLTADVAEGVPLIEGMEMDMENVQLGKILPVSEPQVFEKINELTDLLEKRELFPDKISCSGINLTIYFGGIQVRLGSGGFAEKLGQVPPILEKMKELYADQTGVLHLENFTASDSSIRFVPDTVSQPQEEEAAEP